MDEFNQTLQNIRIPNAEKYKVIFCYDKCDRAASGIPYTDGVNVYIPKTFLQYVYEFYYDYRTTIITCIILHEIAHNEFNIPNKPPEQHYLCDKAAIENLLKPTNILKGEVVSQFYSSLLVTQDYWRARKGLGGHLFNIGWNALNAVSLFYGGSGSIGDLFATDIATRINLLRRDYPAVTFTFQRSQKDNTIISSQ